jgi:GNAT superfamily N-acetyltransferase
MQHRPRSDGPATDLATRSSGPAAVRIRAMRPHEAARVAELTLAGYDAYGRMQGDYRRYLADPARRSTGGELLVAELDGAVVGTVTFVRPGDAEWEGRREPDGDSGFRVLAVSPEAEGRGVGRALVLACLERARELGSRRMVIVSMAWMDRAHRLYLGLGFRRRPDLDVRFPGGDGVVFDLDLRPDAGEHFAPPGPVPDEPPWYEDAWRG